MSSPYASSGVLVAEDIRHRNLARAAISEALAKEEQQMSRLVGMLVEKINSRQVENPDSERLWQTVSAHESLRPFQSKIDANTGDYPSLRESVRACRQRVERQQKARLEDALAPQVEQRRFAVARWC